MPYTAIGQRTPPTRTPLLTQGIRLRDANGSASRHMMYATLTRLPSSRAMHVRRARRRRRRIHRERESSGIRHPGLAASARDRYSLSRRLTRDRASLVRSPVYAARAGSETEPAPGTNISGLDVLEVFQ
jgi:hypothetical protein